MSNFASLLGTLQQSAKQAREEKPQDRKRPSDRNDGRGGGGDKRRRVNSGLPPDARELTISVSFLCIGAQKGGTSWLHEMLRRHPSLCLPEQKEVHFWDWQSNRRKGLGWYSRQFLSPKGSSGKKRCRVWHGECTPCYVVLPDDHIEEIKSLFPNVKLIFLARDLVDRAWSALLMELRNQNRGVEAGHFTINDKIDERRLERIDRESDPDRYDDDYFMDRLKHSTHTQRCDYASGLRRWLRHFPQEQLLILDYGDIARQPRKLLEKCCDHIGVERSGLLDSLTTDDMKTKVNAAVGSTKNRSIRPSLRKRMESYLRPFAKDFNALLEELGYNFKVPEYQHCSQSHKDT